MAVLASLLVTGLQLGCRQPSAPPIAGLSDEVAWLQQRSMLQQATEVVRQLPRDGAQWQRPYALPQPRAASSMASVWFTAYPAATITRQGESVLAALGNRQLWDAFREIGIRGMHTGPVQVSGGVRDRDLTPSVDGNFDRISFDIDPAFGTEAEYLALSNNARQNNAVLITDIIPGHTGKGADFRLAERGYQDYPGIYHMVEIRAEDWATLPTVPTGKDSVNLPAAAVAFLREKGYIVGALPRTIFFEPGVKETDWSATDVVRGVDGKDRRWVYLHYFKDGQPTLNWLDPSFAAHRLVIGDAVQAVVKAKIGMLRLDANGFLGIEVGSEGAPAWSEGHPLSVTSNQIIAGMVRKLGGFTFQELNLTLEDIRAMSQGGADLTYDFVTRPAYHHALTTGDAEFLRLMLRQMREYQIDPAGLIHALQNHDELTLELVHFWSTHKDDVFQFRGQQRRGSELREIVREDMHTRLMGEAAPYNLKAANGISCTTASLIAAALGIRDVSKISSEDAKRIQDAHLLLAVFLAMQPGVFAVSGWDLVGALTLPAVSVQAMLADGDTRWINRGAYDLMGENPQAAGSAQLPRAPALYGSLPKQLADPGSFVSGLRRLLDLRAKHRLHEAEQIGIPEVQAKGLVVMVHRLPAAGGYEVTAVNFGREAVDEDVPLKGVPAGTTQDLLSGETGSISQSGHLRVRLPPWQAAAVLVPSNSYP